MTAPFSIDPLCVEAFAQVFEKCAIKRDESVVILSERASSVRNIEIAVLALRILGHTPIHLALPTPGEPEGPVVKSSGASQALTGLTAETLPLASAMLKEADVVIDMTLEGLMHARETAAILGGGCRIMTISNEHPEILARLVPQEATKDEVKDAVKRCRAATEMRITSPHGTDVTVAMEGAATVGVWGWTDRPGTLAHWPGGLVVSFPKAGTVNGRLVMAPGDMNLTFKRYIEQPVEMMISDDYVTAVNGAGADAELMRDYLADFGDKDAYATSHVGWGMNRAARREALTMYDKADCNGTELRAVAGNFLYSTGANEFAGRFTRGHFDLPMMGCDISLDGVLVVKAGALV